MHANAVKYILLFLLGFSPFIMFAEPDANVLKGFISDAKGNPLMGASVSIPDLHAGDITDSGGHYRIANLHNGKYLVEVRMIGYATATQYVNITGVTGQDFTLSESIIERNEVVVTATSLATMEHKNVTPMQSIRIKELRQHAFTNVVDAIAKLPGVSQLSTGPAISKPVIRGLGYNRIVTLNDGIRQEGQQWGDEHGIEIDDYNVSRIEILKGPASLAYGSDALAGVINIVSDEPVSEGKIAGNVVANYQTNNGMGALHADIAGNINGYSWNVYGTGKAAHDYRNKYDGYVHNSRFNNLNYGATVGINKKWGYSRLSFTAFGQNLGITEGDRDSATGKFLKLVNDNGTVGETVVNESDGRSYKNQLPHQLIEHYKLAWNNNFFLNNGGRIGITLGYQQNIRKEFEDVLNPGIPGLFFLLQTYNYDLKYFFPQVSGWQFTAGINGMQQDNRNKGDAYLIPAYNLFDGGVYLMGKKDWNKLSVSGGARYNYRKINAQALFLDSAGEVVPQPAINDYRQFAAFNTSFSNAVGSIGLSYTLARRTFLKFNIASGFRAPNIAELAANGVHEGTIRYEYGNTALKAENSIQTDLGLSWSSDHILVDASLFYNYIGNYIYIQKLVAVHGGDSIPSLHDEEGYAAYKYSQSNAALYGGELYIDFHPHPLDWLHLENTVSYVRGVLIGGADSMRYLPAMPPLRWQVELRAQKRSLGKWLKNAYARTGLDITFSQDNIFSAYSTETATAGYTLLNAGIGADVVNRKQKTVCSIALSADNITDVAYQNHLSRLKYAGENYLSGRTGVYNTGRNISLMLTLPFNCK